MGRYGKNWPGGRQHDLCVTTRQDFYPPRKLWLVVPATTDGTLAAAWASTSTLSDVSIEGTDYSQVVYEFHNPSVPDSFTKLICELRSGSSPPPFQENLWWVLQLEFWSSGFSRGHTTDTAVDNRIALTPPQHRLFSGFQDLTNPASFGFNSGWRTDTATWADQPEWHPYRLH